MTPSAKPRLIVVATFAAMLALALMVLAGYFGAHSSFLDAFSHFRVHFAIAAAALALPLLASRYRLTAASVLVFAAACLSTAPASMLGFTTPVEARAAGVDGQPVYRLLQMNLRFNNPTPEKVLSLVGSTQPDIITFEETSQMWQEKLALIAHAYPHRISCGGTFGATILSRRPFAEGSEPRCFGSGTLATAKVDLGGTTIDVAAIHLGWPWPFEQSWQIGGLASALEALPQTAILAGDCNATPWSAAVRRVADLGGLTPMRSVGPTWLYIKLPDFLRFAGLPIDQVFSKGAVEIHSAKRLEDTGSDHLPVLVEFSLKPGRDEPDGAARTATVSLEAGVETRG